LKKPLSLLAKRHCTASILTMSFLNAGLQTAEQYSKVGLTTVINASVNLDPETENNAEFIWT